MRPCLLLLALFLSALRAQEATPEVADEDVPVGLSNSPGHALVQIQVEWIEVPAERLGDLLADGAATDGALLREKLLKSETAKTVEVQLVTGRSGEKLRAEACQELIFPTEYEGREINPYTPDPKFNPERPEALTLTFVPIAYEKRNIGSSLEIEATLSEDQRLIDMLIDPELTWHTGNTVWLEQKDTLGNISKVQMPEIYSMRFHSALSMKAGTTLLATILSPKTVNGPVDLSKKVMVFVRANVIAP